MTTTDPDLMDIVYIVEPDDIASLDAWYGLPEFKSILVTNQRVRSFAGAINTAVRLLPHKYFFGASDDFYFHDNWLPPLLELSKDYGMVGPNDLGNESVAKGELAVSYLIRRDYVPRACIGFPENLLYEGYRHNYTDTELTDTAIFNGEYKYCPESIVEHMHPCWGKSNMDETYQLSFDVGDTLYDKMLYMERRPLWGLTPEEDTEILF
jgi:hypothetical protein